MIRQPDPATASGPAPVRTVYVATAAEAAALDARTIQDGTPGPELMRRAAETTAREMERSLGGRLGEGVCVFTGAGNNGGDGWMVAGLLARRGVRTSVVEVVEPRTPDAQAARAQAVRDLHPTGEWTGEGLVVDALLGTGSSGEPRGDLAAAVGAINAARGRGATVAALDLPSGVDATTGAAEHAVIADLTVTFGTVKRGQLTARDLCGRIVVTDIGLAPPAAGDALPELLSATEAYGLVPPLPADAHKGSRGGVTIIGGGAGMAGAAILAGMGALRAGAGSSRICVEDENVVAVHAANPPALVASWTAVFADVEKHLGRWPEAIAIGPGLGTDERAQQLLEQTLAIWAGPLVLDADALNLLAGKLDELGAKLRRHGDKLRAVLTPHPAEMGRLFADGSGGKDLSARRYDVAAEAARRTGAVVLFKGVPTIIATPDGRRRVVASGTPALATGGSGDVLTGIVATLLAQGVAPFDAAAAGAWFHGRAAEIATGSGSSRGVTIEDVVASLRHAWDPPALSAPDWLLAELPAIR